MYCKIKSGSLPHVLYPSHNIPYKSTCGRVGASLPHGFREDCTKSFKDQLYYLLNTPILNTTNQWSILNSAIVPLMLLIPNRALHLLNINKCSLRRDQTKRLPLFLSLPRLSHIGRRCSPRIHWTERKK